MVSRNKIKRVRAGKTKAETAIIKTETKTTKSLILKTKTEKIPS